MLLSFPMNSQEAQVDKVTYVSLPTNHGECKQIKQNSRLTERKRSLCCDHLDNDGLSFMLEVIDISAVTCKAHDKTF